MSEANHQEIRNRLTALIHQCEEEVLPLILPAINDIIQQTREALDDPDGACKRREDRIQAKLEGTLKRVTDVREGETRDFPVWILDISEHGMRILARDNFIPSKLMHVTFIDTTGRVSQRFIEICWMNRSENNGDAHYMFGCRTVASDEAARNIKQEEKIVQLRRRVHKKRDVVIQIIGPETPVTKTLVRNVRDMGYPTHYDAKLLTALNNKNKTGFELLIFTDWLLTCQSAMAVDQINSTCATIPKLALVAPDESITPLLRTGISDCITDADNKKELMNAVERAMVHELSGQANKCRLLEKKAAIISTNRSFRSVLKCYLEQFDFYVYSLITVVPQVLFETQIIFMEYDERSKDLMVQTRKKFPDIPLIACCESPEQGKQARQLGAEDYLCPPPKEDDVIRVLQAHHRKGMEAAQSAMNDQLSEEQPADQQKVEQPGT